MYRTIATTLYLQFKHFINILKGVYREYGSSSKFPEINATFISSLEGVQDCKKI